MKKIGLALSGGGFRATLFHLGLVRFLRDANILSQITHITSVSGGSIFAAHLALNWGRYNGSASEFDAAATELLKFVSLDVRNQITRRFPLCYAVRWPRRLVGLSNRRLTRTGMLEAYYEKHLYGDTSLFQLPECPELHILATNLSEGCLCSFNRRGLWRIRRQTGRAIHVDRIHAGLATVPMAVTASSAFPGFFPPLELTGAAVGANNEFGRQAYTDGGVFDNLGVRMFRCLEAALAEDHCALDGVLVSDVGKRIEVQSNQAAGGMIRTALRASDILMDRVWQLESETFGDVPGFVFARSSEIVDPEQDSTALHPELQRQASKIRTDLDRFTPLEISSLVRHGYCVGRKTCRTRPDLFGADLPADPPWDPTREAPPGAPIPAASQVAGRRTEPNAVTRDARALQASAMRRIWTSLLDYRDWTSYVYVPIIVPLLFLIPYLVFDSYQHSRKMSRLIESISQGSPDFDIMSRLLDGPMKPWSGVAAEEVRTLDPISFEGFEILQDSRILDLRPWNPAASGRSESGSLVYGYRRLKVLKKSGTSSAEVFRMGLLATHPKTQVRFPIQMLEQKLSMMNVESAIPGEKSCRFESSVNFQRVPVGDVVDLIYEHYSPGEFLQRGEASTTIAFRAEVDTAEVTRWILMPRAREYRSFRIIRHETGKPGTAEIVKGFTEYLPDDFTILAFKLVSVKGGYTYDLTWYYK